MILFKILNKNSYIIYSNILTIKLNKNKKSGANAIYDGGRRSTPDHCLFSQPLNRLSKEVEN